MATLYISEFRNGTSFIGTSQAQILPQPAIVDQTVAIGMASAQSSAFDAFTRAVMITTDAICSIVFGDDPTATAGNLRLPANGPPVIFAVAPGQKLAVITNS